ncbi:stachyose synthase [Olea europaea subsp. europaea]|uniref:Stachyose synthase n=1 Tax=Olea europaea subsp. europaea TaxID=158383 RepID=A0A8S0U7F5_OLEEU|nr:stachyose synthase [Olea europaea subsp. europaea]
MCGKQRVKSQSSKGGFLGFSKEESSKRLMNSVGRYSGRDFLSIFRSALHPGTKGHVMICAESGSKQAKTSFFYAITYVHVSENPYNLMKEADSAIRVHLDTFKLLEEKSVPPLLNKFGWLHSFDEYEKFRKYKCGSMLGPDSPPFDPKKPKILISKAIEIEFAEKALNKAGQSGITDLSQYDDQIEKLKMVLDEMFAKEGKNSSKGCANNSCKSENFGLKTFTRDLRTNFKGLDDIYVWHALCGAWGGVRPGTTHLDSKIVPCKLSLGLRGTMDDLALVKIVEGSIGLVHPNQAKDFYELIYSYLSTIESTRVKVDVIHTLEYVSEDYGGRVELAKAYYKGLSKSLAKNFNGIGLISSMQQCNDFFLLGTQQMSMGRVGDDFWFQDPNGDPMGDIGYKYGGVVGAFNCQGAGWDPKEQSIKGYSYCYRPISSSVHVSDIEWDQKEEATETGEAEEYAIYCSEAEELIVTTRDSEAIPISHLHLRFSASSPSINLAGI